MRFRIRWAGFDLYFCNQCKNRLIMSNSQMEKDPVREDILNGARELFRRFGYKKTTMEDIARQIGKSKSALYYYYKTKEEIFEAVLLHDMDTQRLRAEQEVEKVEPAAEKFRVFFVSILGNLREKANEFTIFRADFQEDPLFIMNISRQRDSYLEEYLKNILIWGISRGEVKVLTNAEMEVWARMMNWTMRTIGGKLFMEDGHAHLHEHLAFMADSLFSGVAR